MTVTAWFERRAGSEETLLALYDDVVAAEELDLEEQAHDEAFWDELRIFYVLEPDEPDSPSDQADTSGADLDDGDRVSMSQAVGIIEHLLGGRPMRGGGHSAS